MNEDEIHQPQYPYSWSGKINKEGVPRDEPPSSYDATVMQQGYQAQTPNTSNVFQLSQQAQVNRQYQYIPPAGDGDAYEQGYRPYRNTNVVKDRVCLHGHVHSNTRAIRYVLHLLLLVLLAVAVLMTIFGSMGPVLGFIGGTIGRDYPGVFIHNLCATTHSFCYLRCHF